MKEFVEKVVYSVIMALLTFYLTSLSEKHKAEQVEDATRYVVQELVKQNSCQ